LNDPRDQLLAAFRATLRAALPNQAMRQAVQWIQRPTGRTIVVGGGKAAASMAKALEDAWDGPLEGVVVTRYGHAVEHPRRIRLLEANHPVPDHASESAASEIFESVRELSSDDLVIVLISGGGSALMVAPSGVTFEEKWRINKQLLSSGANIGEMNTVRKHLSRIKGGRLALKAAPARVISLIVSDVVGDDLSTISSGPTVPDPTTFQDAIRVLEKYKIDSPATLEHFRTSQDETPKMNHPAFARVENHLIVTNATALEAARSQLDSFGISTRILSDSITGEARDAARIHALEARDLEPGTAFLSGGETTVTVRGTGRGGRNCEFLLALALELSGVQDLFAIACDTDGIDGVTEAAGAIITPDSLERATKLGLDARALLENNDAYSFFAALGDLIVVGPTGTNVNDFRCVLRLHLPGQHLQPQHHGLEPE
jgi:glycerate 2-kinase